MTPLMLLILVGAIVAAFVIMTYNKMIALRNRSDEAWSDIDVQLKRRYNLIPNIVESVKGYATHEESVLTKVTEARNTAINATNIKEQGAAENMLSGALKSLFAVAESYPDLKANENFLQLQNELVDTEDKIQSARRFYNGVVKDFNTYLQQFPNSMIAGMFKFEAKEFFEIENDEEKENVEVDFSKDKPAAPAVPTPAPEAPAAPAAPAEPVMETPAVEPTPEAPAAPVAEEPTPAEAPEPAAPAEPVMETPAVEPTPEAPAEEPKVEMTSEPTTPEAPAAPEATPEPSTEPVMETPAEPAVETPAPETPVAEATAETPTEEQTETEGAQAASPQPEAPAEEANPESPSASEGEAEKKEGDAV